VQIREALKLSPGNPSALADLCGAFGLNKQTSEAEVALANLPIAGADPNQVFDCRVSIAMGKGDLVTLRKLADEARSGFPKNGMSAGGIAAYLAIAHESDAASQWFERAYDENNDLFAAPFATYLPKDVFQSPRWIALTKRPKFQLWFKARERAQRELVGP
jgi:hypothetical protein